MAGAAFFALALAAGGAQAADARPITIAPQPLDTALNELGSVGNQQILIRSDVAAGKTAHAVNEAPTFEAALLAMLDGTGLTWRREGATYLIVSASDPQSGSAAGDGAEGTVQALVVTAQKREENIQDVPIAMSAFTQEDLTRSQVAGGPDLMTQVPNFTFTKTNFSSYSIQIRGIGTQAVSATTDAAVAVSFNNTSFIRNRFFEQEFYDLQRVEVLRGPQGTLYGRNATAGVVNIISAKPTFHYEAKLSADVANYNSTRVEGMINLPLVDDRVALRLAGAWTKRDGYDTNEITGNRIDGRNLWSTRLSLRIDPTDHFRTNLIWEHFEEDDDRLRSGKQLCKRDAVTEVGGIPVPYDGGGLDYVNYQANFSQGCKPASLYSPDSFETPNGYSLPYYHALGAIWVPDVPGIDPYISTAQSRDLRVIESTVDPKYQAKNDIVELQVAWDLNDKLTLTSETGYLTDELFSLEDYNRFNTRPGAFLPLDPNAYFYRAGVDDNGIFCDPQIGCSDRLVAIDVSTAKSKQFSEELRLSSDFDGPLNFSLGANFLRYDTEDKYYVFINTLSLYSALAAYTTDRNMPPYQVNVSDQHECLKTGPRPPNLTGTEEVAGCVYMDPNPIGSLNDEGHNYFLSRNPYKLISYAVFGEAYYQITPNLKLTAGLRWTVDRKKAPRIPTWVLATQSVGLPVAEVIKQEWREPTGRLTLDWKPDLAFTDETLLYASFAHGYKAGGSNPPGTGFVAWCASCGGNLDAGLAKIAQDANHPKTFEPEFVNALELGSKNTLLGGRLTANGDVFYYDYSNYQISQIIDRSALNSNFDAKVWGVEFEADWRPLENLRLGLKVGYENTRVADGEKAIDTMDRTAGHADWVVLRAQPTQAVNCILPLYVVVIDNAVRIPGGVGGGNSGGCEMAWLRGLDPITWQPYQPYPFGPGTTYPGFNPLTAPPEVNAGAGFAKDLSGNELPNAPHFTTTLTGDYTIPLPNDWLLDLHTDLYYQSEAWTRIFNTPGYDKLKAYTNVNLAAIFSNEDAGWKIMAYVKNVMDRDSITGAFLNSEDTGLTTNVFLTEPRLYGLRVTKSWTGDGWWTGANPNHPAGEPYPLTVEIGGQVQRDDAPYAPIRPDFISTFPAVLDASSAEGQDLDWGDGRQVKLTYRPSGSPWSVSAGVRYGKTNGTNKFRQFADGDVGCVLGGKYAFMCAPDFYAPYANNHTYLITATDWADATITHKEEHTLVDFMVGRDVGLGLPGMKSELSAGVRYADIKSTTHMRMTGIPDWNLADQFVTIKYSTAHFYDADLTSNRRFKGAGPVLTWDAAQPILGNADTGRLNLDWSVTGGVLFGRQNTRVTGQQTAIAYDTKYSSIPRTRSGDPVVTRGPDPRSKSTSAPVLDLSLGLSYEAQRFKIGAGYRWERYYNALDAGYAEHKSYDRTIDGPYFKVSVGFGG